MKTTLGTVPHATVGDLDDALEAAEKALRIWRNTAPAERCRIILKAAQIIRDRVDDMAVAMTLEQGKPLDQARLEIIRGCEIIEWDANEGRRVYGRVIPGEEGMRHTVFASAHRRGRSLLAVELSDEFSCAQGGRRAVVGLLDHSEGLRRDACRSGPTRSCLPRCWAACGGAQSRLRRAVRDIRVSDPEPAGTSGDVHGIDPGRQKAGGDDRTPYETVDHGAWRTRPGHCLRRRGSGSHCRGIGHG